MPKKISDLTAVSSLQSADKVEISRSGTSTVSRDLYDEFADNIGNEAGLLWNVGVNATVSASALTIFLTQANGSNNPSTSINRSRISYRATTGTVGGYVVIDSIATTSTVISAGSTAGFTSGVPDSIYIYAINNAGTTEIAWSTEDLWDEGLLWSTTAEGGAGAADSRIVLYSTTARANVAIRLIGRLDLTEATAGTWTTAPSVIAIAPFVSSGTIRATLLRSSATALTTATAKDVVSITIPPGKWYISGAVGYISAATTSVTRYTSNVSLTSNTSPATDARGAPLSNELTIVRFTAADVPGSNSDNIMTIPSYRVILAAATTFYLVANSTFTVSTLSAYGYIEAQRGWK